MKPITWVNDLLYNFLAEKHIEILMFFMLGNDELFTKEIEQEFYEWKEGR